MGKVFLVIDGHYMIHRIMNNPRLQELTTKKGVPSGVVYGFLKTLYATAKSEYVPGFDKLLVAFDWGNSKRRKEIFPEYRVRPPKEEDTSAKSEDGTAMSYLDLFHHQRKYVVDWCKAMGAGVIQFKHREADDIIAWLTRHGSKDDKFIVVSDDKDFLQLINDNVSVFRPLANGGNGELMTSSAFRKQMGFKVSRYLTYKALIGDPSDMVPGIVGEKTAVTLVKDSGSLKKVKSELKTLAESRRNPKLYEAGAKKGYKVVKRNLSLFDMSKEVFSSKEKKKMRDALEAKTKVDWGTLRRISEELELDTVKGNLGRWMAAFKQS